MGKVSGAQISGGKSAYGRNEADFYPTPSEVTVSLLNFLDLPKETRIWEPACGKGHMVLTFMSHGYRNVVGTDLNFGVDFLTCAGMDCDWIITNPPFSIADKFIERAWNTGKPFAFVLKSQYWHAKRRYELFQKCMPSHILPLIWRPDFMFGTRGSGSPTMDIIWCVWDRKSDGCKYIPILKS